MLGLIDLFLSGLLQNLKYILDCTSTGYLTKHKNHVLWKINNDTSYFPAHFYDKPLLKIFQDPSVATKIILLNLINPEREILRLKMKPSFFKADRCECW